MFPFFVGGRDSGGDNQMQSVPEQQRITRALLPTTGYAIRAFLVILTDVQPEQKIASNSRNSLLWHKPGSTR